MSDNREGKSVLTLKNVTKRFSGLVAVNDLSLDMKERTIHALIGPNGAGKSTAINMITGLLPLTEGEIYHEGTKISGMSAHQIAQPYLPEPEAVPLHDREGEPDDGQHDGYETGIFPIHV